MKNTTKRSTVLRLASLATLASIAALATGCAREPQMQPNVPSTEVTTDDATYGGSANTMPATTRTVTPPPAARTTTAPPSTNGTTSTGSVSTPPLPASATRDAHAKPTESDADRAATAPSTPPPANGATDANTRSDADNTRVNARDRNGANPTPLDQSNSKDDIRITADIRKGVVSDSSLSFTAKNVKIITSGGKVVLRGPVKSAQERATIEAKARATAGVTDVDNQLDVKP